MRISGATGDDAVFVNGVFEPVQGERHNGHAVYRKAGEPGWWLRYCPDHTWAVSPTGSKDANDSAGMAFSVETGAAWPQDVKIWELYATTDSGELVKQPSVRVITLTSQVCDEDMCECVICTTYVMCVCVSGVHVGASTLT